MNKQKYREVRSALQFKPNELQWVGGLGVDLVICCLILGFVVNGGWVGRVFAVPLLSGLMFRAFGAMHDASHGAVSGYRKLNDNLGLFWASICFLPYAQWRAGHLEHHYWAGNIEKDPVMKLCNFVKNGRKMPVVAEVCWKLWFPILSILQQAVFWGNCFQMLARSKFKIEDWVSVIAPLALWSGVMWLSGWEIGLTFVVPSIVVYLGLIEIVNFPHHLELPQFLGDRHTPVLEQHIICRSCTYPRWFEKWVLLNFNYHVEHHLYPTLPWFELRKAHEVTSVALGAQYNIEPGFTWILRNRKRRLTDVIYSAEHAAIYQNAS